MDEKLKLGTKVSCKGYLKKVNTTHVTFDEKVPKDFEGVPFINLEDEDGYVEQATREIKHCDFTGIVVGNNPVSTANSYEYPSNWDGLDYVYDRVQILKIKYIECCRVYYGLNHSRFVPVELLEVIN